MMELREFTNESKVKKNRHSQESGASWKNEKNATVGQMQKSKESD